MRYFVTGATGFIGSHFVARHAQQNEIYALVRAPDLERAEQRLVAKLRIASSAYPTPRVVREEHVHPVLGNLEQARLGLDGSVVAELAKAPVDIFWHFASCLSFEEDKAEVINLRNVQGVKNAIDLALQIGAKRFVYVSTAYTAGSREGEVAETLHDQNGPFNNRYEASKCAAEHVVAELCARNNLAYSILRPSVIIGVSTTKQSGGSITGLYAFIRDLYNLRIAMADLGLAPKLFADGEMTVNFYPIDAVITDIDYLLDSDFAGGPIYHLSASYGFRLRDGIAKLCDILGMEGLELVPEEPTNRTPIEELIGRRAEFYKSYISHPKEFQRSLPQRHGCTLEDVDGYVRSFVRELDAQRTGAKLVREKLTLSDGIRVDTYRALARQRREPLLIVTAYGMPVDFWHKFIGCAGREFDVYTWETRYLPGDAPLSDSEFGPERHVLDAIELLDRHDIGAAHVLGWCTGAKLALKLAHTHSNRVKSLTLLSGGYNIDDAGLKTPYEVRLTDTLLEIESSKDMAQLYYDLIYQGNQDDAASDDKTRAILHATNANYLQYTSLPFRSSENIYRYAKLIASFYADKDLSWLPTIAAPTLVITARNDVNTHPDTSKYVADTIPGATRFLFDEGDHYLMDSHSETVYEQFRRHARQAVGLVGEA